MNDTRLSFSRRSHATSTKSAIAIIAAVNHRVHALLIAAFGMGIFVLLACSDSSDRVETADIRRALQGMRIVQPRLSGFAFAPCSSSTDLIPITSCGEPGGIDLARRLGRLGRRLRTALHREPTSEQLHAAALLQLAIGSRQPSSLHRASTYLREATRLEPDSERRALILSDLSAAHLLLGELLQSPLEVGAALEAALHSLELDPTGPELLFNRGLANYLLGIDRLEQGSLNDPWLDELRLRSPLSETSRKFTANASCWTRHEIKRALDAWSQEPKAERHRELIAQRGCWAKASDRYYGEVLAAAASVPEATAASWSQFRAIEAAYRAFELETAEARIRTFLADRHARPLMLAARWVEAGVAYQRVAYDRALAILRDLTAETQAGTYLELSARSHRLIALIEQVRGEHANTLHHLRLAHEAALKAQSPTILASVQTLLVEVQETIGREEEAWRTVTKALRNLLPSQPIQRVICLQSAARLSSARGFHRVASVLHDRAVETATDASTVLHFVALRSRGEYLATSNRPEHGRSDLEAAERLLAEVAEPQLAAVMRADLLLLRGMAAEDVEARRRALLETIEAFRATEYDRRITVPQSVLARLSLEESDHERAIDLFDSAFSEVEEQIGKVENWADAAALATAARPLAGDLIALRLEQVGARAASSTLRAYLDLKIAPRKRKADERAGQILSYFVRDEEILIFRESNDQVEVYRTPISRRRLVELRELLLLQLRSQVPEARLRATTDELARALLLPVVGDLGPDSRLTIVADDVLAGLPFILLPIGNGEEVLLDRFAVSYALRSHSSDDSEPPRSVLAVAADRSTADLPPLPMAKEEAQSVVRHYETSRILAGDDATGANLQGSLDEYSVAHITGHFVVNTRFPLRSYLVLAGNDAASRLTLEEMLEATEERPALLYLSGCNTGRGLPPSGHGIHSLAQVFAVSQLERVVLSLWPLEDRIGFEIATEFHRELTKGISAPEALRGAQLRHRGKHPGHWAPLAIYVL